MGHNCGTRGTVRPEPNERDSLHALRLERKYHQEFEQFVHGTIDRPSREGDAVPIPQAPCPPARSPMSPGMVSYTHIPLHGLIQAAYDVQDAEMKSAGWPAHACYDISAKIPTGTGSDRVGSMQIGRASNR